MDLRGRAFRSDDHRLRTASQPITANCELSPKAELGAKFELITKFEPFRTY
jgi:hypothetical protein